jgi:ERCC4-type nuclease
MILLDPRVGSNLLKPYFQHLKLKVDDSTELPFADACFEGKGPDGNITIGVERKTLHDMLHCIDDSRYGGYQRIGMKQMYTISVLMIEGHWKPHDANGLLMEGFNGGINFGYCKYRTQSVMYSKLKRYLMSVALSGVLVDYSRDPSHTAYNIGEWFYYFQKPWDQHTSLKELQKLNIPSLHAHPSLVLEWANRLPGIGTKLGELAARRFKTPIALAEADEMEWLSVPGVGVKTAQTIVKEVRGW